MYVPTSGRLGFAMHPMARGARQGKGMLFILSGDVQTGKTRWLDETIERLAARGIGAYGVTAPGVWVESQTAHADEHGFEKLGIDNVLHPGGERIRFADRTDIALEDGTYDERSQAGRMGLGWHIREKALKTVNEHLASIPSLRDAGTTQRELLIVDELGRLELARGEGLVEALRLLDAGPDDSMRDALVVVRDALVDKAVERIGTTWGEIKMLSPDDESREFLEGHLDIASA